LNKGVNYVQVWITIILKQIPANTYHDRQQDVFATQRESEIVNTVSQITAIVKRSLVRKSYGITVEDCF